MDSLFKKIHSSTVPKISENDSNEYYNTLKILKKTLKNLKNYKDQRKYKKITLKDCKKETNNNNKEVSNNDNKVVVKPYEIKLFCTSLIINQHQNN